LLATEAKRLEAACAGATVVALDEAGSSWSTRELATRLENWRASTSALAFVIGNGDGLDAGFKRRAAAGFQRRTGGRARRGLHAARGRALLSLVADAAARARACHARRANLPR